MTQKALDDIMKELSNEMHGFIAASVVGMDGFNIAQYSLFPKVSPENISAEMMLLLKLIETTVSKVKGGEVEDNLLTTSDEYLLLKFIPGNEYCLGVAVNRKAGNIGNLRLISKVYADRLAKAIPHA
jgi:predicted regulator of Ras-like GTPase activity (Roadblock/LC7/MglB family)